MRYPKGLSIQGAQLPILASVSPRGIDSTGSAIDNISTLADMSPLNAEKYEIDTYLRMTTRKIKMTLSKEVFSTVRLQQPAFKHSDLVKSLDRVENP